MDEFEIADILKKEPEKISEIDYGIMSPFSWFEVLRKQSQLAQYCDLSKLLPLLLGWTDGRVPRV